MSDRRGRTPRLEGVRAIFRRIVIIAGVLLVAAVAAMYSPSLPYPSMVERYADDRSRFVAVDGAVIHYKDEGSGPVLALVHGSADSLVSWEPWVERLKDDYRIIRLDLPGAGLSRDTADADYSIAGYARFLEGFRRAVGVEHWAVAGHSVGGAVAWNHALAHPGRVDALILVGATGYPVERPLLWRLGGLPGVGQALSMLTPRFMVEQNLREATARPDVVTDAVVQRFHDLLRVEGNREALRRQMALNSFDGWERIREIEVPTLVLWGEADPWLPKSLGERFHADVEGSELNIVPGVGHLVPLEAPDVSARAVGAFLARHGGAGAE
ncbi:MAG TPA: alpha/beta hydrolase, partial [Arenibaculum sp.]|nr:alpha/beta hydrolase [Arenibaculum sp.]